MQKGKGESNEQQSPQSGRRRGAACVAAREVISPWNAAYLSAGSNLGNRIENLRSALAILEDPGSIVKRVSPIYSTEPLGYRSQPWFLNLALEMETHLSPIELLERCQEIEFSLGRVRTFQDGPRTLDLDILLYNDWVIDQPILQVPHPKMADRRFVLEPLAQIAPDVLHPTLRKNIRSLLVSCPDPSAVVPFASEIHTDALLYRN